MGIHVDNGRSRPLGALLRELAEGSTSLIRQEAQLARLELVMDVKTQARLSCRY